MLDFIREEKLGSLLIASLLIFLVACFAAIIYEANEQAAYMEAHHCLKTSETREQIYFMTISDGKTTTLIPVPYDEYKYTCDNNEIIWR